MTFPPPAATTFPPPAATTFPPPAETTLAPPAETTLPPTGRPPIASIAGKSFGPLAARLSFCCSLPPAASTAWTRGAAPTSCVNQPQRACNGLAAWAARAGAGTGLLLADATCRQAPAFESSSTRPEVVVNRAPALALRFLTVSWALP